MIKKLIHKIKNKELKDYLFWKFSFKRLAIKFKKFTLRIKSYNKYGSSDFNVVKSLHGNIIVNLNDQFISTQIINKKNWEHEEVNLLKSLLEDIRKQRGDGVVFLDCGANFGVFTIEIAKQMQNWGDVYAFEPQKQIYNAMCGTLALNNLLNVTTENIALGSYVGKIQVPIFDYSIKQNFGGLELNKDVSSIKVDGKKVENTTMDEVTIRTLDSFKFERVDLIKIDVEGMELDILKGSSLILKNLKPILFYEHQKQHRKSDAELIKEYLITYDYKPLKEINGNTIAIHKDFKILNLL